MLSGYVLILSSVLVSTSKLLLTEMYYSVYVLVTRSLLIQHYYFTFVTCLFDLMSQ